MVPWVIISVAGILLILAILVVFVIKNKDEKREPDYRVFFILGVTWLPLGIATGNYAFLALGVVFMVLGLANRDKWKEQPKLFEIPEEQRRLKIALIVGLVLLMLFIFGFYLLAR